MTTYFALLFLIIISTINIRTHILCVHENGRVEYDQVGKEIILFCLACLAFVSAFRYYMGTDYGNYVVGFPKYVNNWIQYIKEFDEPGIAIIAKISSLVYNEYISMFVVCAIVTVSLYIVTIGKYSEYFLYAVLLYVFIGAWHGSFNAMRQYLAAGILFAGHRYIYERKLEKYILVVLLAMCFHRTAIIMLAYYFLVNRNITRKTLLLTVIMTLAIRFGYDYLFSIMSFFKETDQTEYAYMQTEVNFLRILVSWIPVLIVFLFKMKNYLQEDEDDDTQFYFMMLIINASIMTATANSAYLARAGIYTEMYLSLAMPRMLKYFTESSRKLFLVATLGCYFVYWIYELHARGIMNFRWHF